jgi:hypothetical protein
VLSIDRSAFTTNQGGEAGGVIAKSMAGSRCTTAASRNTASTVATAGVYLTGGAGVVDINLNWWVATRPRRAVPDRPRQRNERAAPTNWLQLRHTASPNPIDVTQSTSLFADLLG